MKKILIIVPTVILTLVLSACGGAAVERALAGGPGPGDYALNNEINLFQEAARETGWHQQHRSSELVNILRRNMVLNDPNHKSYVYIYANNGTIKAFFPVVGKCTSTDSQASPNQISVDYTGNVGTTNNNSYSSNSITSLDAPQLDGSYGMNEPGLFCFLDKPGRPMIQFNGDYLWSDEFIPLHQAPELLLTKVEAH